MVGAEDVIRPPAHKSREDEAPCYSVLQHKIIAIDHPCVIKNLENGIRSFGRVPVFHKIVRNDGNQTFDVPIWLRPDTVGATPITSYCAPSNNIVLKITVPKRTGRKIKRGSDEAFSGDIATHDGNRPKAQVGSVGRQDDPRTVLRKMRDNPHKYTVEAVGNIKSTYRYRSLSDFQFAAQDMPYLNKVADVLGSMDADKLRNFKLDPANHPGPGQELIPPPRFTERVVPFSYSFEQNPYVRPEGVDESGKPILFNKTSVIRTALGHYIKRDAHPVPTGPIKEFSDPYLVSPDLMKKMRSLMQERPIWTRRALLNRLGDTETDSARRIVIQLAGYQFKGGPWRDAVVQYGLDPRHDPKYRIYQTVNFQFKGFPENAIYHKGRRRVVLPAERARSHLWDGQRFCTDGKVWQLCDITDPTLQSLIETFPVLDKCELDDGGFYNNGSLGKIKAFMKVKMEAIRLGRLGEDTDNPCSKGYVYNEEILQVLSRHPDVFTTGRPVLISMQTLINKLNVTELAHLKFRRRRTDTFHSSASAYGFDGKGYVPRGHATLYREQGNSASQQDGGADETRGNGGIEKHEGGDEHDRTEETGFQEWSGHDGYHAMLDEYMDDSDGEGEEVEGSDREGEETIMGVEDNVAEEAMMDAEDAMAEE